MKYQYKLDDKKEVKKEMLKLEQKRDFIVCDVCTKYLNCIYSFTKKDRTNCFNPIRELYDEKYALEG